MTSLSSDEDGLDEWMNITGVVYVPQDILRKELVMFNPEMQQVTSRDILRWLLLKTS